MNEIFCSAQTLQLPSKCVLTTKSYLKSPKQANVRHPFSSYERYTFLIGSVNSSQEVKQNSVTMSRIWLAIEIFKIWFVKRFQGKCWVVTKTDGFECLIIVWSTEKVNFKNDMFISRRTS